MNTALFMLTSAWMAGADAAPAAPPPAHAPAVIVQSHGSSCGACATTCDSCCDSGRGGLFSRLRGLFNRKNDCCEPACPAPVEHCCKPTKVEHCCKPAPAPTCGGCDSCCDSKRGGLFSRIRGWFGRKNSCCESACDPCHGHATVPAHPVHPAPEPLKTAPKKMPEKVSAPAIELTPTVNPKPIIGAGAPANPF